MSWNDKSANVTYANLFDPFWLSTQLPKAIGHHEQLFIEKIQRLEARAKLWKRLAKSLRQELDHAEAEYENLYSLAMDCNVDLSELTSLLDEED